MKNCCAVILAAGDGKRMKSAHPKVMCEVLSVPMIDWVTGNCRDAGISSGCAVLGAGADEIAPRLPEGFSTALQKERLGTGHAASMARDYLRAGGFDHVAVLNGDAPLLSGGELRAAYALHVWEGNRATVVSARVPAPRGYGRILRGENGVAAIVEEADATEEQRALDEISSGAFWFECSALLDFFDHMGRDNVQGEYYLPDAVAHITGRGGRVGAYVAPAEAVLGANSRKELQELNRIAREMVLDRHLENGVDIPFPEGVVIGPAVEIGPDTVILPGTVLSGNTRIGTDCRIGPNSYLENATVGDRCVILSSQIDDAVLESDVRVGPMSNVRPRCHIHSGVKIGDFVELKNSVVGENTSVAHLTYVGDSDVGARCNFGCGVVTVNYDGSKKYRTVIGDESFIGCNTNLVAPVTVGDRVYAAAGTTITENVPSNAMVIGRARQIVKENWVQERGKYTKFQK